MGRSPSPCISLPDRLISLTGSSALELSRASQPAGLFKGEKPLFPPLRADDSSRTQGV